MRDQVVHLLLRRGREVAGDVLLAHRLADRALDQADSPLPAGPQLGGAVEGAAVEVEVGLDELVGQVRRRRAQHPGEQPGAPVLDRHLAQDDREVLEERRLAHAALREQLVGLVRGAAEVGDVDVPVEARAERAELGEGLQVVGLLDVAGVGALPVAARQPGVDAEHGLGAALGVVVLDQPEHRGQVGDVGVADRLRTSRRGSRTRPAAPARPAPGGRGSGRSCGRRC